MANPPCAWACSMQGGVMMQGSDNATCACSMYPAYHNLPPTCACGFRPSLWQRHSFAPKWICMRDDRAPRQPPQIPKPNVLMSSSRCQPYTPGLSFPPTLPSAPANHEPWRVDVKTLDEYGPSGPFYWSFVHTPGFN